MGSFNNDNVGRHCFGENYFEVLNPGLLENFISENGRGIVYIKLVTTANFHVKSLSDVAQKMCEHGTNAGGSSEISEAFSFEFFAKWRGSQLEMVSRVWISFFIYKCIISSLFHIYIILKLPFQRE